MSPEKTAARIIKKLGMSDPPADISEVCRRLGAMSIRLKRYVGQMKI